MEEKAVIFDKKIIVEKKTEIIDSQGVVNTPKNIADIVVQQTLEPLYKYELFPKWDTYRIADICCGSGNFLLSSYEFILKDKIQSENCRNGIKALAPNEVDEND